MIADSNPKECLEGVRNDSLTPFMYLKQANKCLSSPAEQPIGREYIIRALNEFDRFHNHKSLLKNLVRKAGLYPYLQKYFSSSEALDVELVSSLYQSSLDREFIFHAQQARVFNLLMSGRNVILSAPTSMGKSAIVDSLIATSRFNKVVIVVPTIALIDETRRRIQSRFGREYQIIHHGSQAIRKDRVVYVLTQERVNEREDIKNIDLFIIDEFYKLGFNKEDKARAIALNIALSKLLTVSKQFYMIGPYIDGVRGLEAVKQEYVFIPTEFNTVALNYFEYNLKPNDVTSKNRSLKTIIKNHEGQTIIYCRSQNSIEQVVSSLSWMNTEGLSNEMDNYYKWLKNFYGRNWCYTRALKRGVAVHHGALPRALQQKAVDMFNSGAVKYLICTSTLIEGVNTVAENVVIYDHRRSNTSIDEFTRRNISGRAGRMNHHLVGNVFFLESLPKSCTESNVVDMPLGQQDANTPLNLLAGLEREHLSDAGTQHLNRFKEVSSLPLEFLKEHASYEVESLGEGYGYISELTNNEIIKLKSKKSPGRIQLDLIVNFIKIVEYRALQRLSLHFQDNDDLKNRIGWYIYANSHSEYICDRLKYIYERYESVSEQSAATDRELKIARNIFKHAVPRALILLQDLVNFELKIRKIEAECDLGHLVHVFENSHLPSNFSALEEMGISIETLEKIVNERLAVRRLETLARYVRQNYKKCQQLDVIDRMFINLALR
ncbi:DEAD/DEAH box helicase [Microbulbifer sp. YPW16]|uniref:DEAD/DEAH box helicase n=1 Tax=Microbulbifer sp. YPW16 TaxID=2904242 RepID=UPI001E52244A|nr:DEAD/DEAH box helicase [Microbulbifer sp. YPW16]UHQ54141.1 DEAD/DEAH box helicase [Microbulbifer sp. YPW16]